MASTESENSFHVSEVQPTPNPNAMKFVLDRAISDQPISFLNVAAVSDSSHPIAKRLFAIPGVCGLLMLGDFVTVNKNADAKWDEIKRAVKKVLSAGE